MKKSLLFALFISLSSSHCAGAQRIKHLLDLYSIALSFSIGSHMGFIIGNASQNVADGMGLDSLIDVFKRLTYIPSYTADVIPNEFSRAIVRFYSIDSMNIAERRGTASIIRSSKDANLYFVLTAAHCVEKGGKQSIELNNAFFKGHTTLRFTVHPIIVDNNNDIAVLRIDAKHTTDQSLEEFKLNNNNTELPFIKADHISSTMPEKNQPIIMQGYPASLSTKKAFFRQEAVTVGPMDITLADNPDNVGYAGKKYSVTFFTAPGIKKLSGASGSPLFTLQDNKPHIIGLFSSDRSINWLRLGIFATGVTQVTDYIARAEEIVLKQ